MRQARPEETVLRKENLPWDTVEIQLVYRAKLKASQRPKVDSLQQAVGLFLYTWDMGTIGIKEDFKVMYLNNAKRLLGIYTVSSGGMTSTNVDPKLIFAAALKVGASIILLCHNHPSGDLKPSEQDDLFTQKIKLGAEVLDMRLMDHIILTEEDYLSMAHEGLL